MWNCGLSYAIWTWMNFKHHSVIIYPLYFHILILSWFFVAFFFVCHNSQDSSPGLFSAMLFPSLSFHCAPICLCCYKSYYLDRTTEKPFFLHDLKSENSFVRDGLNPSSLYINTLKPWYTEPWYSDFHDIVNKTQLPFWGFTKHITFDIVNYSI